MISRLTPVPGHATPTQRGSLDQACPQVYARAHDALTSLRVVIGLLLMMHFAWFFPTATGNGLLLLLLFALAPGVGLLLSRWPLAVLLVDTLGVALLIKAAGSASPLIHWLSLWPAVAGPLLGGRRHALPGLCLALALQVPLVARLSEGEVLASLGLRVTATLLIALGVVLARARLRYILERAGEPRKLAAAPTRPTATALLPANASERLMQCTTIAQLALYASSVATELATTPARVVLPTDPSPPSPIRNWTVTTPEGPVAIIIEHNTAASTPADQALAHLVTLVAARYQTITAEARVRRLDAGIVAYFQVQELLETRIDAREALVLACTRLRSALDLRCLVLLAPTATEHLAPWIGVAEDGRRPILREADLMVAAEALDSGLLLVRPRGDVDLVCAPLTDAPLVLTALAPAHDPGAQSIVRITANQLFRRLYAALSDAMVSSEPQLVQPPARSITVHSATWR